MTPTDTATALPARQTLPADAAGLAAFLGQQRGLQLVFLNGCSTQAQVKGLLEAGVGVVIATATLFGIAAGTVRTDREVVSGMDRSMAMRAILAEPS